VRTREDQEDGGWTISQNGQSDQSWSVQSWLWDKKQWKVMVDDSMVPALSNGDGSRQGKAK